MRLPIKSTEIAVCERLAVAIVEDTLGLLAGHSSVGIERAIARLAGVEAGDANGVPWANRLVDTLRETGRLEQGVLRTLAVWGAVGVPVGRAADAVIRGEIAPVVSEEAIVATADTIGEAIFERIAQIKLERDRRIAALQTVHPPWRYVIVATGNVHVDAEHARLAIDQGADVIAVIRSTAQSLLDYVPEGLTREGFGGTFATQANFRLMRETLDEASVKCGRYIRLTNYASGLCMAEMAALGAIERLDMMLSDSMYGILFRDINMRRTLLDQHVARRIQMMAGIIINTGEDNYLTTADAFTAAHTVLASQFVNRAFAHQSGMSDELIGLGHAFEMSPEQENGLLLQMADALLSRTCFPHAPLKYMPPTRHMSGDIFFGQVMDTLFNLVSVATEQQIHLVGMLSEAIHSPHLQDRYLALANFDYVHRYSRDFSTEFEIRADGVIARRAGEVLDQARAMLGRVAADGLFASIEQGAFAGIRRAIDAGRGADGVFPIAETYLDPLRLLVRASPC